MKSLACYLWKHNKAFKCRGLFHFNLWDRIYMIYFCGLSSDPDPDSGCDSDPGSNISPCSGADDSRWDSHSPGGSAEDYPTAGGDHSRLTPDPDTSSPQPRPAAGGTLCCRVPSAATHSTPTAKQGSSSPRGHQGQNSCQAQWGE